MPPTEILLSTAELLRKAHKSLNRGALLLCVALAGADFVVVMLEVISRSVGATFVWTEELSRWLLV
jgi:TRAP-type C4-dicarboxylate transport system permease small subunit